MKWQARIDFVLYLFLFPGILALFWFGAEIAADSWRYSKSAGCGAIQIYFFKTLIPVAGFLLILQGFAELVRCWNAMKTGVWMKRVDDVKETEDALMEQA